MKKNLLRGLACLLLFCLLLPLISCGAGEETPTGEATDPPASGTAPEEELTTAAERATESAPWTVQTVWHLGYVGSATNTSYKNKLNTAGGYYSYTDVITVPEAGTTLTFIDDNTNDNGDGKFASNSAYVISSWKEASPGVWELDTDGANYAGGSDEVVTIEKTRYVYTYTTTLANEHLRFCYRSGQTSSFTPSAYPTVTAQVTGKPGTAWNKLELKLWIEESKKVNYYSNLEGITLNAIGDSYFQGDKLATEYVWLNLLSIKYGITLHNAGKNGSTVSAFVTTNNPICRRYTSMPSNDPQIVLVEGGRNDYNKNTPLGTVDSTDEKTFMGALNVTLTGLKKMYPSAMIVCITPWNFTGTNTTTGFTYRDYVNAMIAVAEAQGVYCINASDPKTVGVDMKDSSFKAKYSMDGTSISHLNMEGMKYVLPRFEEHLSLLYADFLKIKD